jgi:hypothetical protein
VSVNFGLVFGEQSFNTEAEQSKFAIKTFGCAEPDQRANFLIKTAAKRQKLALRLIRRHSEMVTGNFIFLFYAVLSLSLLALPPAFYNIGRKKIN